VNRSAEKLILLVGSNPLPNYLAAQLLKPKSLSFIYSPETEQVKNYLKKVLENMDSDIEEKGIADATDPKCVRGRVQECLGEGSRVHLHYSGGTKVMATHARMQFREAGYDDRHASYLDERRGVLRFDDGYEISLADHNLRLTMDLIVGLHGIERKDRGDSVEQAPTAEDAEKIAKNVFACTELARKLYDIHRENGKRVGLEKAKENPIPLSRFIPKDDEFSISNIPEADWNKRTYKKWLDFLGGGWLEQWVGEIIKGCLAGEGEVEIGVYFRRANGREFEIDVSVVRNHRFYLVSCTTDIKLTLCKSKLFEIAMRARQLGGDLARSALVCLLQGSNDKGAYVEQLRSDVADIWNAPNTPRGFGLDDLKEWAGIDSAPDCRTLREWFNS